MSDTIGDVIIIDDDSGILEVLEVYCQNLKCFRNIVKAKDGVEASKKLRNQEFALILLDINMPRKSGVDITEELKRPDHHNKVENIIVVSGELNSEIMAAVIQKGVKNFLVKPFNETQFQEKVKPILKLS